MKTLIKYFFGVSLMVAAGSTLASGPYIAKIERLQATSVGHPYNTIFLAIDITDSPCSSTNSFNRFTITSDAQQSVILAALMADKTITLYGTGSCNGSDIETISNIRISP